MHHYNYSYEALNPEPKTVSALKRSQGSQPAKGGAVSEPFPLSHQTIHMTRAIYGKGLRLRGLFMAIHGSGMLTVGLIGFRCVWVTVQGVWPRL